MPVFGDVLLRDWVKKIRQFAGRRDMLAESDFETKSFLRIRDIFEDIPRAWGKYYIRAKRTFAFDESYSTGSSDQEEVVEETSSKRSADESGNLLAQINLRLNAVDQNQEETELALSYPQSNVYVNKGMNKVVVYNRQLLTNLLGFNRTSPLEERLRILVSEGLDRVDNSVNLMSLSLYLEVETYLNTFYSN